MAWLTPGRITFSVPMPEDFERSLTPPGAVPGCHCEACDPTYPDEQRQAERAAYQAQRAAEQAAQQAAWQEAKAKAQVFLESILTEEQRQEWTEHQTVTVTGQSGKTYRVHRGYTGNVTRRHKKTGRVIRQYCCLPWQTGGDPLPVADSVAGQVLALRFAEGLVLEKAVVMADDLWDDD